MRYYIIAGEASGDLHGSNLIKELHRQDKEALVQCWGGDKMKTAGATLVKHYKDLAFMGFVEVVKHLPTILDNIHCCKKDIINFKPDVLVLIDYPGFNIRIAEWARKQGYKIVWYISPQVWAWKANRIKKLKRDVDKMLVILPFEKEFYNQKGMEVIFVGHPLVEVIQKEKQSPITHQLSEKPIIAILPGSRKQEIEQKLPTMLQMVHMFPDYQFIIAQASSLPDDLYHTMMGKLPVKLVKNQTYSLLRQSKAALVTSGTATLETALFGIPQVVCYKGNPLSFWLAKKLVNVKYISLVNLIMDKPVVKELIQNDFTVKHLKTALAKILNDVNHRNAMLKDYQNLWHLLGDKKASENTAKEVIGLASD